MKDFWQHFPSNRQTIEGDSIHEADQIPEVNAHVHTPFSFSAFQDVAQAVGMAAQEGVSILGINDFYSTDGYDEWADQCFQKGIFPLFNIEYISLNKEDQRNGWKVNDPGNPGRTYLSGKGLAFPARMDEPYASALAGVRRESNQHVRAMCQKLNILLETVDPGFQLDFDQIGREMTRGQVRERHLAKALREKVDNRYPGASQKLDFYGRLFQGNALKASLDQSAAIENELRNNLLKAGGPAFIPEPEAAFLDSAAVCDMIRNQGGIPTYPFLADDSNGNFTHFEQSAHQALKALEARNIWSVEFITTRNSIEVLESYAGFFHSRGFVVTFGSEHNTPAMEPIVLKARKGTPLTPLLRQINFEGACVVVAHQYLMATTGKGYLDATGKADLSNRADYVRLGKALVDYLKMNHHD